MASHTVLLEEVAEAVADHEDIDWQRLLHRRGGDEESRTTQGLRVIEAAVSALAKETTSAQADPGLEGAQVPLWAVAALLISAAQLLVALVSPISWSTGAHPVPRAAVAVVAVSFGLVGTILVRARRRDARAFALGGFFLCIGSAVSVPYLPTAAPFPALARFATLLGAALPEAFLPYFLWRFVTQFPRRLRFEAADRVAVRITSVGAGVGAALFSANLLLLGEFARRWIPWLEVFSRRAGGIYWLVISVLCLPPPILAWWRSRRAEPLEKARVRWFLGGLAFGILPLFLVVSGEAMSPSFARWLNNPKIHFPAGLFLFALLTTIPFSSSYAVLAYRLLELRVVFHRAAAFALARGTLLVLAGLSSAALALHLYRMRHQPLDAALTGRFPGLLLAATVTGWAIYGARGPLLRRLQAWLVGSRRDPATALADFTQEARHAVSPSDLAALIHEHLSQLVTARSATLLLNQGSGGKPSDFNSVDGALRTLDADSSLVLLARVNGDPIGVNEDAPDLLYPLLPEADRRWVRESGVDLLCPLTARSGILTGLIALGPSRGGVQYSPSDRRAVAALAATASLALEKLEQRSSALVPPAAGECHACGRVAAGAGLCICGHELTVAPIPLELGGKFRLDRVLGRGGMGVVYRAVDLSLGRTVALKTLPRLRPDALERLKREARSMAGFVHPHLALIFGVETWQEVPVLVVEYLAGGSLAARLPPGLPVPLALQMTAAIAGALATMHERGMLHRDVKPQNIAFTADGVPKLLDFGLAQFAADDSLPPTGDPWAPDLDGPRLTRPGGVMGTPYYLSPEALRGDSASPAQDLWSLHLVLWESLTGRHPLATRATAEVMSGLAVGDLPWEELRRSGAPAEVVELIETGLAKRPEVRFSNAADVQTRILEILNAQ